MQIQATLLRPGMVINHNGVLHSVMQAHHHTPGNLRGMMQVKLRNLKSGNSTEVRFRSRRFHSTSSSSSTCTPTATCTIS